jgi:hypothetical protein
MHSADRTQHHSTSLSPGHRVSNLCEHPRSFAPCLLLLPRSSSLPAMPHQPPAHHETSKHDSLNETEIKVKLTKYLGFEFKPRQVNDSSQLNQVTDHLVSQTLNPNLDHAIATCTKSPPREAATPPPRPRTTRTTSMLHHRPPPPSQFESEAKEVACSSESDAKGSRASVAA